MKSVATAVQLEFGGRCIGVRSSVTKVLGFVRDRYAQLVVQDRVYVTSFIDVSVAEDGYHLQRSDHVAVSFAGWRPLSQQLKREITLAFMEARPDLIWIHAAAVANERGAVLLCGQGGTGKSTITAALVRAGWTYLSDDVAPLDPVTCEVLPFPVTPFMRVGPRRELASHEVTALPKATIPFESIASTSVGVAAVIFPRFGVDEQARLEQMTTGDAVFEMVHQSLNFAEHRQEMITWLRHFTRFRGLFRLPFENAVDAGDLITRSIESIGANTPIDS